MQITSAYRKCKCLEKETINKILEKSLYLATCLYMLIVCVFC